MAFRGAFRVDETTGQRWELALERLRDGHSVVIRDIQFSLATPGLVTATAASAWSDPSRVSAQSAAEDMSRASAALTDLCSKSAVADAVRGRSIELEVVADYDTGSVLVARSRDGVAEWVDGRPLNVAD